MTAARWLPHRSSPQGLIHEVNNPYAPTRDERARLKEGHPSKVWAAGIVWGPNFLRGGCLEPSAVGTTNDPSAREPRLRLIDCFAARAATSRGTNRKFSVPPTGRQFRAIHTVTRIQCGVLRSRPPPGKAGNRRPAVRSQSLAALHAIVCGYLLPGEWRRRSAPASLCRVAGSGRKAVRRRQP